MTARKKSTTVETLVEQDAKAQADEIAGLIRCTCDLLAHVATKTATPPSVMDPVINHMKRFLDRRGAVTEDPDWIARMRSTVRGYRMWSGRRRGEDAFDLE